MSTLIGIMGDPGSGKTTSLKNLNPKETFYIDCDGKGLNWRNWKNDYNKESKNYYTTSFPTKVKDMLHNISDNAPHIKYLIIDTLNNIMVSEEMRRCKDKGFDKWWDLAQVIWDIVEDSLRLREDLTVIIICHSQTDEMGFTRIKTNGRKTEKNDIDSKFNTLLLAKCIEGKYVFETRANNSTARTPLNAFEELTIPNDIVSVLEVLKEF